MRMLREEGGHAPVFVLLPVGEGVIVTLGALQLDAEEHARGVVGQLVRRGVGEEIDHRVVLVEVALGSDDLAHNLIPRLVVVEARFEPPCHFVEWDEAIVGRARQQKRLPDVGLMLAVIAAGEQFINELGAFVRLAAVEKGRCLFGRGNVAGEIEIDTADKLGVIAARRRSNVLGMEASVDGLVDVPGQSLGVQFDTGGERCLQTLPHRGFPAGSRGGIEDRAQSQAGERHS